MFRVLKNFRIGVRSCFKYAFLLAALIGVFLLGCPFYEIFGIPCPCCGVTRAWLAFFRGDINLAFRYHALFPIIPAIALLYILRDRLPSFMRGIAELLLALFGAAVFLYAILRWCGVVVIP
jgi:hypothetical protein